MSRSETDRKRYLRQREARLAYQRDSTTRNTANNAVRASVGAKDDEL